MAACFDLAYAVWPESITDFEATCREVAEAGVRSIVVSAKQGNLDLQVPEDVDRAAAVLERSGLRAPACHGLASGACHPNEADASLRARMLRDHSAFMGNVARLGCRTYVVHLGPMPESGSSAEAWDLVRSALDELAPRAEELGIVLALENGMVGYMASNDELLSFVESYDSPAVGLCYDSGHAHVMGDAVGALEAFAPHVVTVHLHDNDGASDQHLIPGQGTIDWGPVVAALARCPRLLHAETEAANCRQWPPSLEVWPLPDVYARYCEVLNPPGAEVCFR